MMHPNTVRTVEERKKPLIPSLGPNLGKLGFTNLTNDTSDKTTADATSAAM